MATYPLTYPAPSDETDTIGMQKAGLIVVNYINSKHKLTGNKIFMAAAIANETGLNQGIIGSILSELDGSFHGITLS